ncbi:MAG: FAD-binding protein, partial [Nitrososphaerales archaeon]
MTDIIEHDLLIVGSGLAGLRAAIEAARTSSKLSIAVISKVQVMRSHSVSAEGGTAAVLYPEEGDSFESHIHDTIKGSDFLADQDTVERLVLVGPTAPPPARRATATGIVCHRAWYGVTCVSVLARCRRQERERGVGSRAAP